MDGDELAPLPELPVSVVDDPPDAEPVVSVELAPEPVVSVDDVVSVEVVAVVAVVAVEEPAASAAAAVPLGTV